MQPHAPPHKLYSLLLEDFFKLNDMPAISADPQGVFSFCVQEHLIVNVGYRDITREIILFSLLGQLPEIEQAHHTKQLLKANLFPKGLDCVFALTEKQGIVLTAKHALQSLSAQQMSTWVTQYIKLATHWQTQLNSTKVTTSSGDHNQLLNDFA